MAGRISRHSEIAGRIAATWVAALVLTLCGACGDDPVTQVNRPPRPPSDPNPVNGSDSASIEPVLEWRCSDPEGDALTYDVYFGDAPDPPPVSSAQTGMSYTPGTLVRDKTYYWKVTAEDSQGNAVGGPLWTFATAGNPPPTAATNPMPSDNATDVPVTTTLRWQASDPEQEALTYDIYFGASPTPPYVGQQAETEYTPPQDLDLITDYYWRIDVGDGASLVTGPVWRFTTSGNAPPSAPFDPTPENQAVDQAIDVELRWTASDPESDPLKFDVKLDRNDPPVTVVASDISRMSVATSGLDYAAPYFWQVVAKDDHGNERVGPVWRFTTMANQPPDLPSAPGPADGSVDVPLNARLEWTASDPESDPMRYDVLLGTDNPPTTAVASNITAMSFDPIHHYATAYYWRVVAKDDHGNQTQGPVWSFATRSLAIVGHIDTPGNARAITIAGLHAYVADGEAGLQVINVSNPASPVIVGYRDTPGYAEGVVVTGRYGYMADDKSGLQVMIVVTASYPGIIGSCDTPGSARDVAAAGSYAYVADGESGLQVIDVSNALAPFIAGYRNTPGGAQGVAAAGSYAYIADGESGLQVINVSNPASPTIVDWLNTPGNANDIAVAGSYAYIADGESGLHVIDVSNPASVAMAGGIATPGNALGVAAAGSYAYIADGESGLQVIDVSNPASPVIVGTIDTPGDALGIAVAGSYAYVADGAAGLQVIRVE